MTSIDQICDEIFQEIKDLKQEIKDLKEEIKDLKEEIKSLKEKSTLKYNPFGSVPKSQEFPAHICVICPCGCGKSDGFCNNFLKRNRDIDYRNSIDQLKKRDDYMSRFQSYQ